jgi:hypothetical protein
MSLVLVAVLLHFRLIDPRSFGPSILLDTAAMGCLSLEQFFFDPSGDWLA